MKKILSLIFLFFAYFISFAQLTFEKGYYIDNEGTKTEGLIENSDWRNNPIFFNFKSTDASKLEKKSIDQVKEFGIYTKVKFVRETVDIDRSSGNKKKLPTKSPPSFTQETLFLGVLLEGSAKLYLYVAGDMTSYFVQNGDAEITQLLSRDYMNDNNIVKDETYIRQLFTNFKCKDLSNSGYEAIRYTRRSLESFLNKYNKCEGNLGISYKNTSSKGGFHLSIRPGVNIQSIEINDIINLAKNTKFESTPGFRIGIEAEYLLSGMDKKWSILLEESYQQFSPDTFFSYIQYTVLDYKAFETALGIRHYFTNNPSTRLFANTKIVVSFPFDSKFEYETSDDLELLVNYSVNIGAGILLKNRFQIEANYWLNRKLTNLKNDFTSFSLMLGLRLF